MPAASMIQPFPGPMVATVAASAADAGTGLSAPLAEFALLVAAAIGVEEEAVATSPAMAAKPSVPAEPGKLLLSPDVAGEVDASPAPVLPVAMDGSALMEAPESGTEKGVGIAPSRPHEAAEPEAAADTGQPENAVTSAGDRTAILPLPPPSALQAAKPVVQSAAPGKQPENIPEGDADPVASDAPAILPVSTALPPAQGMLVAPAVPMAQAAMDKPTDDDLEKGIGRVVEANVPELKVSTPAIPSKAKGTAAEVQIPSSGDTLSAQPAGGNSTQPLPLVVDGATDMDGGGLSAPLLTQTMPLAGKPSASLYSSIQQGASPTAVVQAQAGTMGADIGVEIARAARGDRKDLLIRLDPRDMGRIDVRLSFDRDGLLRAVMSAESPAALDLLRRESGDLNRALADAGIRSDAQSLRFDTRAGHQGQGAGQGWQRGQQEPGGGSARSSGDGDDALADTHYRPLRASGQVDLMA